MDTAGRSENAVWSCLFLITFFCVCKFQICVKDPLNLQQISDNKVNNVINTLELQEIPVKVYFLNFPQSRAQLIVQITTSF